MTGMIAAGYRPRPGECWGYAPRRIRPTAGKRPEQMPWSNHAWGLAVDINAPANPMGSKLVTDMPPAAVEAFTDLGFRWGGTYPTRPDAMHFEYLGTVDQARAAAAGTDTLTLAASTNTPVASGDPIGRSIVDVSLPSLRTGATGPHVRAVQALLNAKHGSSLAVDGSFGANTDAAVRQLQQSAGLEIDGVVGPNTWKYLLEHP